MSEVKTFSLPRHPDMVVGDGKMTLIAGPCMAESLDLCMMIAERTASLAEKLGFNYVFKASFDKANRTSSGSVRGFGIDEGLAILSKVNERFGLPVTTDIHLPDQASVAAEVVDILQIPAFLCRQTDLLVAASETGKPVNVKKGQFLAPHDTKNIVEKLQACSAAGIVLTERGTTFGYNTLIVDFPGLEVMRNLGVPVCLDATHSAQRPGGQGTSTGGVRESIPSMVRSGCAVGIDCLFLETHPEPEKALSDAATQWPLDRLENLLIQAAEVHKLSQSLPKA